MKRHCLILRSLTALTSIALLSACAERDPVWDAAIDEPLDAHSLGSAAAVIDAPADRALMLQVDGHTPGIGYIIGHPVGKCDPGIRIGIGKQLGGLVQVIQFYPVVRFLIKEFITGEQ